ncbi:MAG: TonB-dependent receptor [Muribaculaceae bacterium]|nr:TonB-dependent receptor [Muribaculaceae bacterium]
MNNLSKAILWVALLPTSLLAQENSDSASIDSIAGYWDKVLELNEVVVIGHRTVLKQEPDRIVYLTKNDMFTKGLNGMEVLDRIPRVSVEGDAVTVAGKSSVRYIVDGRLLEMPDDAIAMQLKNLQASGIERIEVLTTPPAKYATGTNVAFISITTRNESLGTRGTLWGRGVAREKFSYMLGGNLSQTTRKVELSVDASWNDNRGINDLDRTFYFSDHEKASHRSTHFTNRALGLNGLFKYKITDKINTGGIANFSTTRMNSNLNDVTNDNGNVFRSFNTSPSRPNNALTLTTFCDWQLDNYGKVLSLTYNWFNKSSKSFSDVTTTWNEGSSHLTNDGHNKYHIHSLKLDATLPFKTFKMETGMAYTTIGNKTALAAGVFNGTQWIHDPTQSNTFDYEECTAAAYFSAEKSFSNSLFGKMGLRYEHTRVKGLQSVGNEKHNNRYGYLFPSLNLSWNNQSVGRFSLSYSMGITRPNFGNLNPFRYYTTTTDYVAGNPDLKPSITHNAELSYNFKGIYAVLYNSYNHNAIGYVTRFNNDGSQFSIPLNCIDNNKVGIYASCYRSIFDWWNVNIGGEVFNIYTKSKIADFKDVDDRSWSGKLEFSTSWMLNRQQTLIFNVRFSHYFPYHERMVRYKAMSLIGFELRYTLLNNRLTLTATVSDPFGWNITKSTALYSGYSVNTRNNIHSHAVALRVSYAFGGNKVNQAYRDSKERESSRSY